MTTTSSGPSPPAFPRKTNLGLRIVPATMSNGMRVALIADPNASEIEVTMRYQVGANDDPVGQEGIAHLVEHLMFQPVIGAESMLARLEDAATSFNATTTFDATTYTARAAPAKLGELLSMEALRLQFRCAMISDSVFEREREVVLNELRLKEAQLELMVALDRALYPNNHPYRRSDTVETVGAITRAQACAFAEAHYGPANAVLVVSGPIEGKQFDDALLKAFVNVGKRDVKPPVAVPQVPAIGRRVDAKAPIDDTAILVAWPMPEDPALRLTILTVASRLESAIAGRGLSTDTYPFGDVGAPMIGVLVQLDDDEKRTPDKIVSEIEAAVNAVPKTFQFTKPAWLAQVVRDRIKQSAIYAAFSRLEEGSGRDEAVAAMMLAGRDPNAVLLAQGEALNRLSSAELERVAETHLRFDQATVAMLTPTDAGKRGPPVALATPVHDVGQRRDQPDPAEAQRPGDPIAPPSHVLEHMQKRTLANGMHVVLLPVTSIPTVEIRLVFGSGTAADAAGDRGAAVAAGKALEWNPQYLEELLQFAAGGGTPISDVGGDSTVFVARGVDMHLDLLLTGLRRWVRDGIYNAKDIGRYRREARRNTSDHALDDAWRVALFGASHPYAQVNTVSPTLSIDAVERFRKLHHTPGNATLVIAGRFDAELADKWIDYLFADWTGDAPKSREINTTTEPISIANDDTITQVGVRIAIPTGHGGRAHQLVAAEMLNVIAEDVRHQLGASYTFWAGLEEAKFASTFVMGGWIDAARTRDAFELVRLRLAALRTDPAAAARTFVTARKRVIVRLLASTSSAYELAQRVHRDIELERAPLSDTQTADHVNQLTLDKMTELVAELDLSRAVVVLRGPHDTLDDAFAALGRVPKRIAVGDDDGPPASADAEFDDAELDMEPEARSSKSKLSFSAFAGYSIATVGDHGVTGTSIGFEAAYRLRRRMAVGVNFSVQDLDGTYEPRLVGDDPLKIDAQRIAASVSLQFSAIDARQWGAIYSGIGFVDVHDNGMATSDQALFVGAHGGYDVANFGHHHITVYGRADVDVSSETSFADFVFGAGYRYR